MLTGVVFDIQRYSLGDGDGIRTTVFMKGCNLRCRWCQNPESFSQKPEIAFHSDKCIKCGFCKKVCLSGAINLNNTFRPNPELCISCGECALECPTKARYLIGRIYTVTELLTEVQRDTIFFKESGGGITLSGGEATQQFEFIHAFLKACKEGGLNTVMETNGFTNPAKFSALVSLVDRIYFDLKIISPDEHQSFTGAANELILENARRLANSGTSVTFRIPLIPGMTLNNHNINGIGSFLKELGVLEVELCLYQNYWESKLKWLQTEHKALGLSHLFKEEIGDVIELFKTYGIKAHTI